jgi:hypothetical protein
VGGGRRGGEEAPEEEGHVERRDESAAVDLVASKFFFWNVAKRAETPTSMVAFPFEIFEIDICGFQGNQNKISRCFESLSACKISIQNTLYCRPNKNDKSKFLFKFWKNVQCAPHTYSHICHFCSAYNATDFGLIFSH